MIKVKVLKVKEISLKFFIYLFLVIILYFVSIYFLKNRYLKSRAFDVSKFEEYICADEMNSRNKLNIKLVLNELFINDKIISNPKEEIEIEDIIIPENNRTIKDEIAFNENNEEIYISTENVERAEIPGKYEVKELPSGKIQVGKVYINNYSNLKLNTNELSKVSDFQIKDGTSILIYHTHTSEAYEEIGESSNFRSTDDKYNVVSVGNTLTENLSLKGFDVLHNITKHDTPSYNGAYKASLSTIDKILNNKKYDILIDLHRDALSGNLHFRPTAQINGETVSKLMFVIGTNASGLSHDNWMKNLKLALLIQNTAEEMYPGLFRDLNLSKSRYNQNVSDGAFILEVGSTGNTLNETKTAMKYFSNVIEALKK